LLCQEVKWPISFREKIKIYEKDELMDNGKHMSNNHQPR
jgi:hypothetical protein